MVETEVAVDETENTKEKTVEPEIIEAEIDQQHDEVMK